MRRGSPDTESRAKGWPVIVGELVSWWAVRSGVVVPWVLASSGTTHRPGCWPAGATPNPAWRELLNDATTSTATSPLGERSRAGPVRSTAPAAGTVPMPAGNPHTDTTPPTPAPAARPVLLGMRAHRVIHRLDDAAGAGAGGAGLRPARCELRSHRARSEFSWPAGDRPPRRYSRRMPSWG